jgi:alpha-galactosidase
MIRSYRHPEGWQAILRIATDKSSAIIVIHSFDGELPDRIEIELHEAGNFKISSVFSAEETELSVKEGIFTCSISGKYTAVAILLKP